MSCPKGPGGQHQPRQRSDGWVYCASCGAKLYKGRSAPITYLSYFDITYADERKWPAHQCDDQQREGGRTE
jgi:hypothetical protein